MIDRISLYTLYQYIKKDVLEEENPKEDFLTTFQKRYGHNLSSMDFEIIKAWLENGLSEELILGAVDEANYNGVSSLRYIDKVLFAWKKKGFKTMKDVSNHMTKKDNSSDDDEKFETSVMEFNWLDDEE
jgi:DNA replication protein